jgi:hypothetical protein
MLFSLTTLGLCMQYLHSCPTSSNEDPVTFAMVFFWCLYGLFTLFANSGFVAWCILLRNLWGGKHQEIPLDIVFISVFPLLLLPFFMLGQGAVAGVRACQKYFCVDVLEQEERVESGVEMDGLLENGEGEELGGK